VSENDTPIERAVELLVYAPIGLAMFAKDTMPTFLKMFVSRGQTEVSKHRKTAEQQASQYRTIGHFAVKYGGPEVQRRAGGAVETVRRVAEDTLGTIAATASSAMPASPPPARPAPRPQTPANASGAPTWGGTTPPSSEPAGTEPPRPSPAPVVDDAPGAADLPIPGYDLLSATQVIERLEGLAQPDLLAIRAYEITHRARTTILGKISQLAG
jgi:hypothetical protein